MAIRMAGYTSPGMARRTNEDDYAILGDGDAAILADGMGGLANGRFAATIVTAVGRAILGDERISPYERLLGAMDTANNAIYFASRAMRAPMGAVAVAAIVRDGRLHFAHVGDAQLHLFDPAADALEQATRDHSCRVRRNEVIRYLGARPTLSDRIADYGEVPFPPAAYFVMNSDGVTGALSSGAQAETVQAHRDDAAAAAERTICKANARGASDNITVVIGINTENDRVRMHLHPVGRAILAGLLSAGTLLAPVVGGAVK